VILLTKDFMTE